MSSPLEAALILYLPERAAARAYAYWVTEGGGRRLVDVLARRARRHCPGRPVYLLDFDADAGVDFEGVLSALGVPALRPKRTDRIGALAEAARATGADVVAFTPLGWLLAPADLVERMLRRHFEAENTVTLAAGAPEGAAPAIVGSQALGLMEGLGKAGAFQNLRDFFAEVRRALERPGVHSPVRIRDAPFASLYDLDPARLPRAVVLAEDQDYRLAERALAEHDPLEAPPASAAGLELWKRLQLERRRAELARLTAACEPRHTAVGKKLRVTYFSDAAAFAGSEESLCQIVENLPSERVEATVLVAREGILTERLRRSGVEVACPRRDLGYPVGEATLFHLAHLREHPADLVHISANAGEAIATAARLRGLPIVQQAPASRFFGYETAFAFADRIVAESEFVRRRLLEWDVDPAKIAVVPPGVDVERFRAGCFDRSAARAAFGLADEDRVAVMVARFARGKRHDVMLRAAAIVAGRHPRFRLLLVGGRSGDAETEEQVHALVEELGLAERVVFAGFQQDVRLALAAAEVFALPAEEEAFGRSVIEAMAMELAVVVPSHCAFPEIVSHQDTGLLFRPADEQDLAERLREILDDDALRLPIGRRARQAACERYCARKLSRRMVALYDECASLS